MLAHDCLLYEDVPGSFAEPGLDSPGREDQAQAGDQSSAQEHQRAFDTYADGRWDYMSNQCWILDNRWYDRYC